MDGTMWEGEGAPDPASASWLASHSGPPPASARATSDQVDLPPEPGIPGRLGPYQIVTILGEGAMGTVYRARRDNETREVALKTMQGEFSPALYQRFDREATIAASLDHPGILPVYESGEVEGVPYMACLLIEGARNLTDALRGQVARKKLEKIYEVTLALGHAHERGVIHRDVKPDNVLFDRDNNPYVCDFGLANQDELEAITVAGTQLGTPAFMAPEQVTAEREKQGPASDVWALGVLLYEAVLGVRPFAGASFAKLFRAILKAEPKAPRELNPRVPKPLQAMILKCLAREPSDRYPDANALALALEQVLKR